MDEHKQWKKIEHRLMQATKRLAEATALIEELPDTETEAKLLTAWQSSVDGFRTLAANRAVETKPEPSPVKVKIKEATAAKDAKA